MGIHSGDAGLRPLLWRTGSRRATSSRSGTRRCAWCSSADRPPYETMAALVCQGLFDRFPRIRVASIEAGASWVPILLKKLAKAYGQMPGAFASDPVETFRDHVWVAPFYEDDLGDPEEGARSRPHPLRFGLAARRGTGRTDVLRRRPPPLRLQRLGDPRSDGRKRVGAHPAQLTAVSWISTIRRRRQPSGPTGEAVAREPRRVVPGSIRRDAIDVPRRRRRRAGQPTCRPAGAGSAPSTTPIGPGSPGPSNSADEAAPPCSRSSSRRSRPDSTSSTGALTVGLGHGGPDVDDVGATRPAGPPPRADAARRGDVVPALQRAGGGLRPARR